MQNPLKTAWNRLDRIAGTMTISVLFGKFTGDLTSYYLTNAYPREFALWVGFVTAVVLFIVWPILEKTYDDYLKRDT